MSGNLSYIGTIKGEVDVEELRDAVSSYVRNRGHLIDLSGVDDNSFVLDAKPDGLNILHGMRITFTVVEKVTQKSEVKTSLEVRGKMYVTGGGWAWLVIHIGLSFLTGIWFLVTIYLGLRSQKMVKSFFNDVVTDSKNSV